MGGDLPPDEDDALVGFLGWMEAGVADILDVRGEWSNEEFVAEWSGWMDYRHLSTHDDGSAQSDEWFDAGVAAARELLADEAAGWPERPVRRSPGRLPWFVSGTPIMRSA